jgi:hypothetical protein
MMELLYFDRTGTRRDAAWFTAKFGGIQISRCELPGYRCTEVWEHDDPGPGGSPAAFAVTLLDPAGLPARGVAVGRWWSAHPGELDLLPDALHQWHDFGLWFPTNANGAVEFGMGNGDYYAPPAHGPSAVWAAFSSDLVAGLGMLAGTAHAHFDVVFRWFECEPDEPPPQPPPADAALTLLAEIAIDVAEIRAWITRG